MSNIVFHWINFAILVGVLVYFGKKKLSQIFAEQRDKLKLDIETTNSKFIRVKEELSHVEKLVANTDAVLLNLRTESVRELDSESRRLREECQQSLDRLTRESELKLNGTKDKALASLQRELFDLAVAQATETLKKDKKDYSRDWLQQISDSDLKTSGGQKNYAS